MSFIPIVDVVTGAVTGIGNAVGNVAKVFVGSKAERDQQLHDDSMSARAQYAAEFIKPTNWFDSLINGLNRLPRPVMALGVMGLMVWCPLDPAGFSVAMLAYEVVPLWLAGVFTTIVGFYFTFRHLEKRLEFKRSDPLAVQHVINAKRAMEKGDQKDPPNPAIQAWRSARD